MQVINDALMYIHVATVLQYRIAENFKGETIYEFRGFRATRETFLAKFGHAVPTYDMFQHPSKLCYSQVTITLYQMHPILYHILLY